VSALQRPLLKSIAGGSRRTLLCHQPLLACSPHPNTAWTWATQGTPQSGTTAPQRNRGMPCPPARPTGRAPVATARSPSDAWRAWVMAGMSHCICQGYPFPKLTVAAINRTSTCHRSRAYAPRRSSPSIHYKALPHRGLLCACATGDSHSATRTLHPIPQSPQHYEKRLCQHTSKQVSLLHHHITGQKHCPDTPKQALFDPKTKHQHPCIIQPHASSGFLSPRLMLPATTPLAHMALRSTPPSAPSHM
jgi:hypothetical protein